MKVLLLVPAAISTIFFGITIATYTLIAMTCIIIDKITNLIK